MTKYSTAGTRCWVGGIDLLKFTYNRVEMPPIWPLFLPFMLKGRLLASFAGVVSSVPDLH